MGTAVKKTISLRERLRQGFLAMQGYWARKAKEKGILTERDLNKYLAMGRVSDTVPTPTGVMNHAPTSNMEFRSGRTAVRPYKGR